jgi:6-phosphogluconolactonase
MKKFDLFPFPDPDALADAVARAWLDEIETANRAGKPYRVALSGGRIAQKLYSAVVDQAIVHGTVFDAVEFFWADERCLPPTDPESNYRVAQEFLFGPLKISKRRIHRIRGEDPPEAAAGKAASEICRIVPLDKKGQPGLDLVLLGLGEDAHTASLFPGESEEVASSRAVYRAVFNSPKPPPERVTLGYGAIAAARQVWMLASGGAAKERALRESLIADGRTPFGRVLRDRNRTKVFSDIVAVQAFSDGGESLA